MARADIVYVHDQLRLGVRAAPSSSEKSIAVVKTGDALTVLGEEGDFINIRTESGLEGWVSKSYVSTEPPAQNRLAQLKQEFDALQQKYSNLQKQVAEGRKESAQQLEQSGQQDEQKQAELQQLKQDNEALREQLAQAQEKEKEEAPGVIERYGLLIGLGLILACFFAGLLVGVRWKAKQVAERIGGLQI